MRRGLAARIGGADWRRGLAARIGGADWRRGLAARIGGVGWRRGLAARIGGADWRRGLAAWVGGVGEMVVGLLLRFVLGGLAIAASGWIGKRLGGVVGGLFAAFPAVYLAALIGVVLGPASRFGSAEEAAMVVSRGALAGMLANVVTAWAAARFVKGRGWQQGLGLALLVWVGAAILVFELALA